MLSPPIGGANVLGVPDCDDIGWFGLGYLALFDIVWQDVKDSMDNTKSHKISNNK